MPTRPPVFRPAGWRPTPAWTRSSGQQAAEHALPRGWRQLRDRILLLEPLCRPCRAEGRVSASEEVDHIVPRSRGGRTEHANLQAICAACHRAKTFREATEARMP